MIDKHWFESWFDTEYYHQLYCDRNDEEAQQFISRLLARLALPLETRVLDVACGKGRHSRYIAQLGYDTTGIDLSPHSIAAASTTSQEHLRFQVWDMRELYQPLHYGLVVNLFSSFGYFELVADDQKAIHAMAANLQAGGTLVMDYMNPEKVIKMMASRAIIDRGDIQFHIKKGVQNGFIRKQIDFIAAGENHHYEECLKVIKPEQFQQLFYQAGLEIVERYGDYDLQPFDPRESERQIMIARKR